MRNKIENLLGPPQFYKVSYGRTYRANNRGPGGPKKTFFQKLLSTPQKGKIT